ncbi:MAG: ribonuclease HI [Desulfobacterales bacterium]|nr:ribonuclease HI [Desulfobacterales bacterium]
MAQKKFYAVRQGHKTGLFTQWFGNGGAQTQVRGFPGAEFKSFATREEAEQYLSSNPAKKAAHPRENEPGIRVFTDGGALGNPGPGGYGVVILMPNGEQRQFSGGFRWTTNNRMELMGGIMALEALNSDAPIMLCSDSRYMVDAVNKQWVYAWRRRGWKKANGEPALNVDLWKRLLVQLEAKNVALTWVKGHSGNIWNERCDQMVHEAIHKGDLAIDAEYEKGS